MKILIPCIMLLSLLAYLAIRAHAADPPKPQANPTASVKAEALKQPSDLTPAEQIEFWKRLAQLRQANADKAVVEERIKTQATEMQNFLDRTTVVHQAIGWGLAVNGDQVVWVSTVPQPAPQPPATGGK